MNTITEATRYIDNAKAPTTAWSLIHSYPLLVFEKVGGIVGTTLIEFIHHYIWFSLNNQLL